MEDSFLANDRMVSTNQKAAIEEDSFVANDRTIVAKNINVDTPLNDH
jgi:hypothetical protein